MQPLSMALSRSAWGYFQDGKTGREGVGGELGHRAGEGGEGREGGWKERKKGENKKQVDHQGLCI